jgi:RND family efflux transporter MFP subunit
MSLKKLFAATLSGTVIVTAAIAAPPALAQDIAPAQVRPVKLMTIDGGDSVLTRRYFGQVVAQQTVDLAFQVGGQIVELPVLEGATLAKGDLIAKLDVELFELALEQARIQADQAQRTVARLTKLRGSAVSTVSVDDVETQAELATISVRDAERNLRNAVLTAPFDALVAARDTANFTTVSAGTPVVRLHDMSELRIEINVPEVLFQRVGIDPDVEINATFPASPRSFPLEIREFIAEASAIGQTFQLTFGMVPPKGLRILPGSSVTVTASINGAFTRIRVPASAIAIGPEGETYVMTFAEQGDGMGVVTRTPVTVAATPDGAFFLEEGPTPGTEIVAAGSNALRDGQRVRRFTGFTNQGAPSCHRFQSHAAQSTALSLSGC